MLQDLQLDDLFTHVRSGHPYYRVTSQPRLVGECYECSVRCVDRDGTTDYYPNHNWDDQRVMAWNIRRYRNVPQGDPWEEPDVG